MKFDDPLKALRSVIAKTVVDCQQPTYLLGGIVGFISYDYIRQIEQLPKRHADDDVPLYLFVLVNSLVVFDHLKHRAAVMSLVSDGAVGKAETENRRIIEALTSLPQVLSGGGKCRVEFVSSTAPSEFEKKVIAVKRYIRAGDIFQVVLSRREEAQITVDPFQIYRALRMLNPSPYMFYLDFGRLKLIGSSPEMLVKLTGRVARVSPIAGTRERGKSVEEDQALENELLKDDKERAEHVMLVDLARNDLGRCCRFGTVRVSRLMRVEKYSHVQHIVSDVQGEIRDEFDQFDLLRACFPAGTVTGAPKVRAMEIIDELEKEGRGVYAGSVGYFSPSGNMDMCITIRTILVKDRMATIQAGAGIVADSEPAKEFAETENKLSALREAIHKAEEGQL